VGAGRNRTIIHTPQTKDTAGWGPRAARRIIGMHPWHGQADQTEPWTERMRWCRNAWLPNCTMRNLLAQHQGREILPSSDAMGCWLVNAPLLLVLGSRRHAANQLGTAAVGFCERELYGNPPNESCRFALAAVFTMGSLRVSGGMAIRTQESQKQRQASCFCRSPPYYFTTWSSSGL
jgi:hypothetical protein